MSRCDYCPDHKNAGCYLATCPNCGGQWCDALNPICPHCGYDEENEDDEDDE